MRVDEAENYILNELENRLAPTLYYHGLHHTLDVTRTALELAALENITDTESLDLLKTAALYHDCGFMNTYAGHEEEGCRIAGQVLPGFGYTFENIEVICRMIMATKIPQTPRTHLEYIIADADLDYLGRADFEPIAATLYEELSFRGKVSSISAWNEVQVRFIAAHTYWTQTERDRRNALKAEHLRQLRALV